MNKKIYFSDVRDTYENYVSTVSHKSQQYSLSYEPNRSRLITGGSYERRNKE